MVAPCRKPAGRSGHARLREVSGLSRLLSRPAPIRSPPLLCRSERLCRVPTSRATGDQFLATGRAPVGLCGLSTLFLGPRRGRPARPAIFRESRLDLLAAARIQASAYLSTLVEGAW